jgi:hypothetical protein
MLNLIPISLLVLVVFLFISGIYSDR